MDQASASRRARDPLTWHLQYWLDLDIIALLRNEDGILTGIRIDMEQEKIADTALKNQLQNGRKQFQRDNLDAYMRHWHQKTLDDEEAQKYVRDLDRMLVDRGPKMRAYIRLMEMEMNEYGRTGDLSRASQHLGLHHLARRRLEAEENRLVRQRLEAEETRDSGERNRHSNSANGAHNHEAEGQEDIKMNDLEGDDDAEINDDAKINDDFEINDDAESDDD